MIIGIDPDIQKSGVAVVECGQLTSLQALSFPDLLRFAKENKSVTFVIEDVESDKTTYIRKGTNAAQMRKIAQNVGMVKAAKRLMVECLQDMGIEIKLIKPLKGWVKKKIKEDGKFFNQLTGWKKRSSEDKRDAALIAYAGSKYYPNLLVKAQKINCK